MPRAPAQHRLPKQHYSLGTFRSELGDSGLEQHREEVSQTAEAVHRGQKHHQSDTPRK